MDKALTTHDGTAKEILALERAALDRWGVGDPGGFLQTYAEGITYFDPATAARIDGRAAMDEYYRPWAGRIRVDRYEILNPQVVAGDGIALLTYNLVNFIREAGAERLLNRWNSTVVYQRQGAAWKSIHSHWSYTQPALADANPA